MKTKCSQLIDKQELINLQSINVREERQWLFVEKDVSSSFFHSLMLERAFIDPFENTGACRLIERVSYSINNFLRQLFDQFDISLNVKYVDYLSISQITINVNYFFLFNLYIYIFFFTRKGKKSSFSNIRL